jgi:hypothetical protein
MLLGGLWHGASWNFVIWGAIHGGALAINHIWRDWVGEKASVFLPSALSRVLTLLVVALAWVPFRSQTFDQTLTIWRAMMGLGVSGFSSPMTSDATCIYVIGALSFIALCLPNTRAIFGWIPEVRGLLFRHLTWKPRWTDMGGYNRDSFWLCHRCYFYGVRVRVSLFSVLMIQLVKYIAVFVLAAATTALLAILAMYINIVRDCDRAGFAEDRFVDVCHDEKFGDYAHGAFFYDLEPQTIKSLKNADVVFLGNSRTQFAFSGPAIVEFFHRRYLRFLHVRHDGR